MNDFNLPAHIEAQAYLAAIITSSDDAIISKDLNGNITSWNPAAERIFGFTAEEAVGKHISLLMVKSYNCWKIEAGSSQLERTFAGSEPQPRRAAHEEVICQ